MKPKYETIEEEAADIVKRLDWLGCRSTGSDRLEERLAEIHRQISATSNDDHKGTLQPS